MAWPVLPIFDRNAGSEICTHYSMQNNNNLQLQKKTLIKLDFMKNLLFFSNPPGVL